MSPRENSLVAAYEGRGQLKSRPSETRVVTIYKLVFFIWCRNCILAIYRLHNLFSSQFGFALSHELLMSKKLLGGDVSSMSVRWSDLSEIL